MQKVAANKSLPLFEREFVVTGHRVTPGTGTVLALRRYYGSGKLRTDKGEFEKLTIHLPEIPSLSKSEGGNVKFAVNDGSVNAYYSTGSSSFPGRSGCFGYAADGQVMIVDSSSEILIVHVMLDIPLYSPGGWKEECTLKHIDQELLLEVKHADELTAWDGKRGEHIYDETYPQPY
jgi:hypothetical protein